MRLVLVLGIVLACGGAANAAGERFPSSTGTLTVQTVASGLVHPWSLAFLSDGRMLVSERPGRLRIVARDGTLSSPLGNVPKVFAQSQAGLMDVLLANDFGRSHTIFVCYAEHDGGGGRIAVLRAQLVDGETPRLDSVKTIFRQKGPPSRGLNIGCRMVQAPDGNLFVTLGDHFAPKELAQRLDNHIGKIVRISSDGVAPQDNPFIGRPGALPEIWAYGLRNAEGLTFNPADGKLWEQEHGPMGGDEINIIEKGKNYGWPLVSYGLNYDGSPVGTGKATMPGVTAPLWHWTPSIAPSGMAFYTGDLFPDWKGSLLNGALKFELLSRLELSGDKALKEEQLLHGLHERIRDVRQGPDGAIYLLTDNSSGRILRVAPASR
ncbi:MAG TPA: PQQ-dependent sugar dehydrogenase [Pseudolabrys sp.]|nr:PQQ-dependent sugar dehydrogenase [Pseudolabrys sp.]